jgi:enhanced filamentous growth protein 1
MYFLDVTDIRIPFDRALDFANKERIIDLLYPLFVQDIKSFLYHPANYARTNAVMAAAAHRQTQSGPPAVGPFTQQIPRRGSDIPQRPMMSDRSMSFPTPPSSASSITNGNADLPWVSQTGLTLDTSLHGVTRSLPGTPATSPSSAVHAGSQTYGALTDSQIHHRQSLNFEPSFKREAITQLHLSYPTNSQFSSRRASSASDMGPPPSAVHSRLNTVDKDQLDNKHDSLPESHEEGGYPGELHYNVPPGTPISASSNQVYHNTPSIVAMKGRVEAPGTPTHGQSPGANGVNWPSKHDATTQSEYSMSSQGQHSRQLSYQMRSEDQPQMVSQNGVSRNIFDSPLDRDTKISPLDYNHNDEVLSNDMPNGHNLSHGPLPAIKQEPMIKDGPPSSKRRRTINQDSMPYGMGGTFPSQSN